MGRVLIEKLLRSCPDIEAIYLLVRSKIGKRPAERVKEFTEGVIFEHLKTTDPNQFNKLYCVCGDITKPCLDLSNDDFHMLCDKVDIIFHMAANVKFDQQLKDALMMNTGGTLRILELAKQCKKLRAFVHVSTSYCHCDRDELEEKIYGAPHDPRKMLELVTWLEDDLISLLTPRLIKKSPNTYAYTKCLTEQLVSEYAKILPIAICRPSIVSACLKEPIPGWVGNLNGPTGLIVGAGKGIIRTMHCNPEMVGDLVPVDLAINCMILIGKELYEERPEVGEIMVVHATSGKDNQIKWGEALEMGRKHFYDNPFSVCLWYPGGSIKSNYLLHIIAVFFFHLIPAYVVDFIMIMTKQKPFLVRAQQRIQNGLSVLQYYTTRNWYFHNENIKKISGKLNSKDREEFSVDFNKINWNEYILNSVLGARQYCMKEGPETLPYARKVLKRLYYADMADRKSVV